MLLSALYPGNVPSLKTVQVPETETDLTGATFPSYDQSNKGNTKCATVNEMCYTTKLDFIFIIIFIYLNCGIFSQLKSTNHNCVHYGH